jgi:protein TonB
VAVIATGARPGKRGGQRELFTEETSTVLVSENGGVLRLSAAVTAGQLLFLTNKETRREVVAQVKGKRDFRPTSCYVEVQFSEPSPGFWGIEFPEMPELAPANAQQTEAAERVRTAQAIARETKAPAAAPSAHDVAALKEEVEALREQLKLLQTQTAPGTSSAPVVTSDPPRAPVAAEARREEPPKLTSATSKAPADGAPTAAQKFAALPIDRKETPFFAEEPLPKPVIRVNRGKLPANYTPKPKGTARRMRPAEVLRIGLQITALLLVTGGAVWYLHWMTQLRQPKKLSASAAASSAAHPAPGVNAAPPKIADARPGAEGTAQPGATPAPVPGAVSAGVVTLPATTSPGAAPPVAAARTAASSAPAAPPPPSRTDATADATGSPEKSMAASNGAKGAVPRRSSNGAVVSAAVSSRGAGFVPPRLINSVRAVASPNALQYFDQANTATVTLDAVVDLSGHVSAMKVLAGPASLRGAAMDALKQYRYEPAKLRGRPVAAHVTVKVGFLFEK